MVRQNWQLWSGVLNQGWINNVIDRVEKDFPLQDASTFSGDTVNHRRSKVRWITEDEDMKNFLFAFADIASQTFGIHINSKADIQYTEYLASEGGHYDWHHDVDWNRNDGMDRKISVTVQLSDPMRYAGGDFAFSETENPVNEQMKMQGSILCFPSYLQHRVTPVTSGTRKSIVAWFEGPQWR